MKIRIGSHFEEWTLERLAAERAATAEANARYTPDFDEGWLTLWARDQTQVKYMLIEQILRDDGKVEYEAYIHCGRELHPIDTQYGSLYLCAARCGFKVSASTLFNWADGRGRRPLAEEGVTREMRMFKAAIDMNRNGQYFVTRESNTPLGVTAGEMGLG